MKIRQRLRLQAIISILIALTLAGLVLAILRLNRANELSVKVSEVITGILETGSLRRDYVRNHIPGASDLYFSESKKVFNLLQAIGEDFLPGEAARIVEAMLDNWTASTKIFAAIVDSRGKAAAGGQSASLAGDNEKRLIARLNGQVNDQIIQGRALEQSSEDARTRSLQLAGCGTALLAVLIAAALINAAVLRRVIWDRMECLHAGAAAVGGGNLNYRIAISGDDEIVELAAAFNTMTAKLSGLYQNLQAEIAERKKIEQSLQQLNETLEEKVEQRTCELQLVQQQYLHAEKLAAIGKLSASIAHEFNSPLQAVMTVLKGLEKTAGLEGGDARMLDLALGESERMKNLIRSLKDFNRPSSGRKVFMDVHQSVESLLVLTRSDFSRKKIAVACEFSPHLPQILAVPDQVKQVLLNLLTNAMDACAASGGAITIRTFREEDRVAVAIRDDGIGIPAENLEHIFRPFFTTKAEVKGTGLGLAVSYGIVKKHQGELRVESEPGAGTTFTVVLPINSGEDSLPGRPAGGGTAEDDGAPLPREKARPG